MRPDQYKQKQSRRYKAKHGIRTVPKQDNRGRPLNESDEIRSNESKESVLPNDDDDFKPRKSYRRRQIGSNAFRYNELEATSDQEEDESHAERATKELLETIKNADFTSSADSYFQFRDEKDWSNIVDGESTHELISIDFSRLEDLLSKIPLYERLDVSKDELTEVSLAFQDIEILVTY
ncbi:hypothetical protein BKA69DRAFT_182306 [Paraphysoderma sedebokerense]|nr:hypothetical protein BKA69DRAFT_182306 [Paraphysoderma sedebokerense]